MVVIRHAPPSSFAITSLVVTVRSGIVPVMNTPSWLIAWGYTGIAYHMAYVILPEVIGDLLQVRVVDRGLVARENFIGVGFRCCHSLLAPFTRISSYRSHPDRTGYSIRSVGSMLTVCTDRYDERAGRFQVPVNTD